MRINSIISILKSQILQRKQTKPTKKAYINIKDSVKISKAGKTLQKDKAEFLFAKKALSKLPDVRQEKIQSALSNIKNNIYNTPGIREKLSKNLLKSGLFGAEIYKTTITPRYRIELRRIPDIRKNKINEVREKIKSNFYNTKTTISKLSERILKNLGF